jgi:hypothetical protein
MSNSPLPGWTRLASYYSAIEADFHAAVLRENKIPAQVFGANSNVVNWFWQGFNPVDLFVPEQDLERAQAVLKNRPHDDLEPAEEFETAPPPTDADGEPLVVVAAFDNVRDLRDAKITLASANLPTLVPPLLPRGNKPPGHGKRFRLRVAQKDFERAGHILTLEAQEDSDEPRCPKCGSWQVRESSGIIDGLANMIGYGTGTKTAQCGVCGYRGELSEFLPHKRGR